MPVRNGRQPKETTRKQLIPAEVRHPSDGKDTHSAATNVLALAQPTLERSTAHGTIHGKKVGTL